MKTCAMLFVKYKNTIKGIEPIFLNQYITKLLKHVLIALKIHGFFFLENISNSIHRYLLNAVCIRLFNVNYSDTTQSCLSHCAT